MLQQSLLLQLPLQSWSYPKVVSSLLHREKSWSSQSSRHFSFSKPPRNFETWWKIAPRFLVQSGFYGCKSSTNTTSTARKGIVYVIANDQDFLNRVNITPRILNSVLHGSSLLHSSIIVRVIRLNDNENKVQFSLHFRNSIANDFRVIFRIPDREYIWIAGDIQGMWLLFYHLNEITKSWLIPVSNDGQPIFRSCWSDDSIL